VIFQFKKFTLNHGNSSMKVGTDAVLIAAWADTEKHKKIVDIGTGCGIIALITAQKSEKAAITAIDIDTDSILEAALNFSNSPWKDRLSAQQIAIQDFSTSNFGFDHIISNPPFFDKSMPSPTLNRHNARHTSELTQLDFFQACRKLITDHGKISIIIPSISEKIWIQSARQFGFYKHRVLHVFSYPNKPAVRQLIEFGNADSIISETTLFIRQGAGLYYSDDYISLTKDYYL
jgi:tRNA1Val (adenine37-N6)-methyltransferase